MHGPCFKIPRVLLRFVRYAPTGLGALSLLHRSRLVGGRNYGVELNVKHCVYSVVDTRHANRAKKVKNTLASDVRHRSGLTTGGVIHRAKKPHTGISATSIDVIVDLGKEKAIK